MKIIETDNYGRDYPDESFVNLPPMTEDHAASVARAINSGYGQYATRFWRVVPDDYVLQPGFEP